MREVSEENITPTRNVLAANPCPTKSVDLVDAQKQPRSSSTILWPAERRINIGVSQIRIASTCL